MPPQFVSTISFPSSMLFVPPFSPNGRSHSRHFNWEVVFHGIQNSGISTFPLLQCFITGDYTALFYKLPAMYFHIEMLTCILMVCFK